MAAIKTFQSTSYIGKDGIAPIYVVFYLQRQKIALPTKISVKTEHFDDKSGKVKTNNKNHKDHNLVIEHVRARVNDIMVKYRLEKKELNKDLFMKEYNRPTDFNTLFDFFENYVKTHPYEVESTTLDVHIDVMNKLKVYYPTLQLAELNEDFILKYKGYLRKVLKNKDTTINKNLATLKKYIRLAMKAGYITQDPFENIKISRKGSTDFAFMTEEELAKMIELYKSRTLPDTKQQVLQFFLFLCLSSLHITDAKNLKIEQIGTKTFTYFRIKNRNSKPEPIVVPISSPFRKLLKEIIGMRAKGVLFPKLPADQKINQYIKEIASSIGINKKLSTKAGRHTFATIFLKGSKDLATLKEILGHSDYRETLLYAHILEESKLEGIKSFNTFSF